VVNINAIYLMILAVKPKKGRPYRGAPILFVNSYKFGLT